MGTIPFTQQGQNSMPGNAPGTTPMNYSFLPGARSGATQQDGNITAQPSPAVPYTGNSVTGQVPVPYTANDYQSASNINNPFSNYTGFNLGLNSAKELNDIYGPLGDAMYFYLNQGAGYNPAVLNSLINQIQPQVQEGIATLGSTAGMLGNRFGSAYQQGTADYLGQVNQNELGMASGLYQHSQDTINQDMMSILGDAWKYKNNQGSIFPLLLSSILPTLVNKIPGIPQPNPVGGGPFSFPTTPPTFPGHPTTTGQPTPTTTAGDATAGQAPPGGTGITISSGDQPIFSQQAFNDAWAAFQQNPNSLGAWQNLIDALGGQGGQVPTDVTDQTGNIPFPGDTTGLTPPAGTMDTTDLFNQDFSGYFDIGSNFGGDPFQAIGGEGAGFGGGYGGFDNSFVF